MGERLGIVLGLDYFICKEEVMVTTTNQTCQYSTAFPPTQQNAVNLRLLIINQKNLAHPPPSHLARVRRSIETVFWWSRPFLKSACAAAVVEAA